MATEKIVQMPLEMKYADMLEAEATANDRVACRQAAWIVKRYYDGLLVPALDGMSVVSKNCGARDTLEARDGSEVK